MAPKKKTKSRKQKTTGFEWTNPFFGTIADPNKVGKELVAIKKKYGRWDKGIIVREVIDNPKSAMRPFFPDAEKAAELYWLEAARKIITNIRVVVTMPGGKPQYQRLAIRVGSGNKEKERGYYYLYEVKEVSTAESITDEAINSLEYWFDRYEEIRARLPGLFTAIETVVKKYRRKRSLSRKKKGAKAKKKASKKKVPRKKSRR